MISDDTEHTVWVARSLLDSPGDADLFQRKLAWRLRWWLIGLPAGVGFATLRSIIKLWLGFPASRSGVFSAGNGPAMRSAIIGAYFADSPEEIRAYVRASTRLTHTDPKAETAALAVALTAAWITTHPIGEATKEITNIWRDAGSEDTDWIGRMELLESALTRRIAVREFACEMGLGRGVSGYCYHSIPVALYAWIRHRGDFRSTVEAALDCGGDTDTVGAICGALAGIDGEIPSEWLSGIIDWPISPKFLHRLASDLEACRQRQPFRPASFPWPLAPIRNLLFLLVVLGHGLRRIVPW